MKNNFVDTLDSIRNGQGLTPIYTDDTLPLTPMNGKIHPKGYWIYNKTSGRITCSNCACVMRAHDLINGVANYCPNCGSLM